jgi:branched-chain amino acid transport system substrate-binding protein
VPISEATVYFVHGAEWLENRWLERLVVVTAKVDMAIRNQVHLLAVLLILTVGCPHQPEIRPWNLPALTSDDPRAEAEMREARELAERGATQDAEQRYRAFIAERPKDPLFPIAQLGLGRILLSQNRLADARALFDQVAGHPDPSVAGQGRFYQGVTAQRQGNSAQAIELLEPMQGRTIDPEDTALLFRTLAAARTDQTDFVGALKALDGLIKEAVSERDREKARAEITEIAGKKANRDQVLRAYQELNRDGHAWPQIARRALKDADRDGDIEKMRDVVQALKDQGLELDAEIEAFALRAARPIDANPQVIGAILSLSGRAREVGDLALRGLMLAADLPPSGPPAAGAPQLIFRDDGGDPERAVQAVNELVSVHRAVAIIGPIDARAAVAAATRAAELGVPLIALAPVAQITDAGPMVFRLFPAPQDEAHKLVAYARGQGMTRFAVLHPKGPYGSTMRETFEREVALQKGQVVAVQSYEPHTTDFRQPIEALRQVDFEALFIPDASLQIALVAPALAVAGLWGALPGAATPKTGRTVTLLMPGVAFDHQLIKNAGRYLQGAVFSVPFDPTTATGAGRIFADQFYQRYGLTPDAFAAVAHDAYRLVRAAVATGAATRKEVARSLCVVRDAGAAGPNPGFSPARNPFDATRLLQLQGESFSVVEVTR